MNFFYLVFAFQLFNFNSKADDLGFRYRQVNGVWDCFDSSGKKGLNPYVWIECSDHREQDLSGFDFRNKDVEYSNFSDANLSGANLIDVGFTGCNLSHVNFTGAVISVYTELPFSRNAAYNVHKMLFSGREEDRFCYIWEYGKSCDGANDGDDTPYN